MLGSCPHDPSSNADDSSRRMLWTRGHSEVERRNSSGAPSLSTLGTVTVQLCSDSMSICLRMKDDTTMDPDVVWM